MRNSKDDSLTRDQFLKLWEVAREEEELDRVIFVCAGHLGMRASEIANLQKGWIDFQRQAMNIPYKDGEWKAKSKYAARTIPYRNMRPRVRKEIERFFDYHDEIGRSRSAVYRRIKKLAQRADLSRNVYPHSLRATAAFQLAEAGLSAQALRQIMGWSQLNTAQAYISQAGRAAERELEQKGENLW